MPEKKKFELLPEKNEYTYTILAQFELTDLHCLENEYNENTFHRC